MSKILCVDDEPSVGCLIEDTLSRAGHIVFGARDAVEALQVLARESVDLIVSDFRMHGLTGLEFLALLRREANDVPLIMVTGSENIEHAVAAKKAGAIDYITKPLHPAQLELAVEQALEVAKLRRENDALRREVSESRGQHAFVGDSALGLTGRNGIVLHSLNVDEAERALIRRALEVTGENRTRAAALLGISVRTLRNKLNGARRGESVKPA